MKEELLLGCSIFLASCSGASTTEPSNAEPPKASTTAAPPVAPQSATALASSPPASSAPAIASVAPPAPPPECPDGMVKVKGGSYEYGLLKKKIDVGDFCVDKTEATAEAYEACVKAGKCNDNFMHCGAGATYGTAGMEHHPIVCVDFAQASSYCDYKQARLPTAEEWEWVGRNGAAAQKYAWGNEDPKDQACWAGSSKGVLTSSCDVGSSPAGNSPLGLSDLTGNVLEWTTSKADAAGTNLIACGGSWKDGLSTALTIDHPTGFKKEYRCGFLGIRCWAPPLH
jgi:sulfatase modifying factor 1